MFQKLVNHNEDIRRLVEKGYAVAFDSNCLIVRDIPYLDSRGALQLGAMVAKLVFTDNDHVIQDDHQIYFAGDVPYGLDGAAIPNLGGGPTTIVLSEKSQDVVVQRSFSNKPRSAGRFENFFDKIESYVSIICGPAVERFGFDYLTFRVIDEEDQSSVFKFHDTLTSRAELTDIAGNFRQDVIAIIGLGGTGAYVLDYLVKTPVAAIRAFDADAFHVHNAFRSPGRLIAAELNQKKADVYKDRYDNFRHGLDVKTEFIDETSGQALEGVTFAFVCVDKGSSRSKIFELLLSLKIPFIDVGMGLNRKHVALEGMMRVTYFSVENGERISLKELAETTDNANDEYRRNIQISELNALNAALAVIRFKQIRGFYREETPYYHLLMGVGDLASAGDWEL